MRRLLTGAELIPDKSTGSEPAANGDSGIEAAALQRMFGRDGLYLFGFTLQLATSAVVTPILTRSVTPTSFGAIATCLAIVQVLVIVAGFGLNIGISRVYSSEGPHRAEGLAWSGVLVAGVVASAVLVSTPLWVSLVGLSHDHVALDIAVLQAAAAAATAGMITLARCRDKLAVFSVMVALQSILAQVAGVIALTLIAASPAVYLGALAVTQSAALLVGICALRPRTWQSLSLRTSGLLVGSAALVPQQLASYVLNSSDRLLIQGHLGFSAGDSNI